MSVFAFRLATVWETEQLRSQLRVDSEIRFEAAKVAFEQMRSVLYSMRTLYQGSQSVDRQEFRLVVSDFIKQTPGIEALAWIPKVPGSERQKFEAQARQQGYKDYLIKQRGPDGKLISAGPDIFYFPVLYVEPLAANAYWQGLDLAWAGDVRERLLQACQDNRLVAGGMRRNREGKPIRGSVSLYLPFFAAGANDASDLLPPCPGLKGFIGGVFNFAVFYEKILHRFQPAGIDVVILDLNAPPSDRLLYFHPSRTRSEPAAPEGMTNDAIMPEFTFAQDLNLGGRTWRVICRPTDARLAQISNWRSLVFGGFSLLMIAALVFYLVQNLRATRQQEAANRAMEEQIKQTNLAREEMQASERRFRTLFESNRDALMLSDPETGQIVGGNQAAVEMFGCRDLEEFTQQTTLTLSPPVQPEGQSSKHKMRDMQQQAMDTGEAFFEWTHRRLDGSEISCEVSLNKVVIDNQPLMQGNVRDVTQQRRHLEELALMASVYENSVEGIVITDATGKIERVNPGFTKITGYSSQEAVGQNPRLLKSDRHDDRFYAAMWDDLSNKGQWSGEIWNRRKDGEIYPEWLTINRVTGSRGETTHYVGVFHDISELKRSEEKLTYRAHHDHLTGLPNRSLFRDRLQMAMAAAKRTNTMVGVVFLDLDDFKNVNDSLGHLAGDMVLKEVSSRLQKVVREEDTVARLGGDEFLLAITRVQDPSEAARAAQRVIQAMREPIDLGDHQVYIGASLGISLFPQDGQDVDTLIKNCDIAMYRAKNQGKNNYAVFTEAISEVVVRRFNLENELRKAMAQKSFCLHYQPKVETATGLVLGVEALVRWQKDDGELIYPDEFIPLAEATDIIYDLSPWVLSKACEDMAKLHTLGFKSLTVAVNLSAKQFQDAKLTEQVEFALNKYNLPPRSLSLEITEHTIMDNVDMAVKIMEQLSQVGVKVAVDDFGTGYSSLRYLSRLPLSAIKIDKSFVDHLPDNRDASVIALTIISMAHNLGLRVVAEGVDQREQLHFLQEHDCEEIQGFYFSRPLPLEQLIDLLKNTEHFDVS